MTNSITSKFHLCFSRPKKCSASSAVLAPGETRDDPNSVPKSYPSSSSSSSSTVVFKDSSSLCDRTAAINSSRSDTGSTCASATLFASTPETNSVAGDPDLSSAIACQRLLLPSSPRRSNAIADPAAIPVGFGVAVPTYSDDPYTEFRRSMEEMAGAAGLLQQGDPRGALLGRRQERLHELLLCYLALNRKHAHRYIIDAFSDLFVIISSESAAAAGGDGPTEGGDHS